MSDQPGQDQDPAADTQMFKAFVERDEHEAVERPRAVGAPFRILTLLIGLVVFAGLLWLLFQL
jgi:hypothetical protein